mmetsp:Transcript_34276/g.101835  ORF Transcript_34276/g.101835 Transcript_34276/m.101835 type:complete len:494 (+) Transcript_34276:482-1963(+)
MASTIERPSSSTSCSMSRSSFSKLLRSRMYHEPSTTSGALRLNSKRPSPAGCCDHETEMSPAVPMTAGRSFSTWFSAFGLSPSQTTREEGFLLLPASIVMGRGPSGLVAAQLCSVKSRFSHSAFSLSRSSSSFFFVLSNSCAIALPPLSGCTSPAFFISSCSVGKMSTTWALSEASAWRAKASVSASSPTLYSTVSRVNLFARTSFVMFSMTAIIFFTLDESWCTQREREKPVRAPPQAASSGGVTSIGCELPCPYTTTSTPSLSPLCRQWISCSVDSRVAMPSRASLGSMRWLRSLHRRRATASGKTSSAPMPMSHSLMRSYWARTVGGDVARVSPSCQALFEPYSPLTTFLGAPGSDRMQSGLSFRSLQSCRRAEPEADMCAAFISTESPGFSFAPKFSSSWYAHTMVGARQICSGVSSSRIAPGTLIRSSSWQMSRVRAVPIGRDGWNFVGLGITSTASSCCRSVILDPACSMRPMPVMPRQMPDLFSSA